MCKNGVDLLFGYRLYSALFTERYISPEEDGSSNYSSLDGGLLYTLLGAGVGYEIHIAQAVFS
jgi:hypothetical protein